MKIKQLYYKIRIKVLILYWRFKIWDARFTGKYIVMPLYRWHIRNAKSMILQGRMHDIYEIYDSKTDRYFGNRRHPR